MDMKLVTDLLEALMIICFGLSWPIQSVNPGLQELRKAKACFLNVLSGLVMYLELPEKLFR